MSLINKVHDQILSVIYWYESHNAPADLVDLFSILEKDRLNIDCIEENYIVNILKTHAHKYFVAKVES